MAPPPRSKLKALPDLTTALSTLRGTPQLTPLATSLSPILSPSRPPLQLLLPPLLTLFRTGLVEVYYPPSPVATLALSTAASFLQHVYTVELPLCWDLEVGRGGRGGMREGMEEGRAWEEVLGSVLLGFECHLRTRDAVDPATGGSVKDQPYRTAFALSIFGPLIDLLASENVWRIAPRHRYAILDTLGEAIAKHSPNKTLLRSLLPPSLLASLISDGTDRFLTNGALELAYRLIWGSKPEKASWSAEVFTEEVFGDDTKELRESFVNLSGSGFFQGAREMLDSLSSKNIARAQPFTTPYILHDETKLFPDDASTTPWWICRDFLAATVDIERDSELVEARFVVGFETVQRVEVEAQKGRDALTVTVFLSEAATLSNVPIEGLPTEIHHKVIFHPPSSSLSSLQSTLADRALRYPSLALPSSNRKASDAPPISASYVQRVPKSSSSLAISSQQESFTRERAEHLACIAEVDRSESGGSSQGSREEETPGEVQGRLEVDSRVGEERRMEKEEEETPSQSLGVGKEEEGDESSELSEIESEEEEREVVEGAKGRKKSLKGPLAAVKSRTTSVEMATKSRTTSLEEPAPAPAFVLVSPASKAKAQAKTQAKTQVKSKAKKAPPPRKVDRSPSIAGSQESTSSRPRRTIKTPNKLEDAVPAKAKSKAAQLKQVIADAPALRTRKSKAVPPPKEVTTNAPPLRTTRSRAARSPLPQPPNPKPAPSKPSAKRQRARSPSPLAHDASPPDPIEDASPPDRIEGTSSFEPPPVPAPRDQPPYPKRRKITDPSPLDPEATTATTLVETQAESEPYTLAVVKEKKVAKRTYGKSKVSPVAKRRKIVEEESGEEVARGKKGMKGVEESPMEEEQVEEVAVVKSKPKAKVLGKGKGKAREQDVEMEVESSVEQEGRRQTRGAKAAAKRAAETDPKTQSTLYSVVLPPLLADKKSTKSPANPKEKPSTILVVNTPEDQEPATKSPSPEPAVKLRSKKAFTSFEQLVQSRPGPAPHSPSPEAESELRHNPEEDYDDDFYDVPNEPMPPPRQQQSSMAVDADSHAGPSHLKNLSKDSGIGPSFSPMLDPADDPTFVDQALEQEKLLSLTLEAKALVVVQEKVEMEVDAGAVDEEEEEKELTTIDEDEAEDLEMQLVQAAPPVEREDGIDYLGGHQLGPIVLASDDESQPVLDALDDEEPDVIPLDPNPIEQTLPEDDADDEQGNLLDSVADPESFLFGARRVEENVEMDDDEGAAHAGDDSGFFQSEPFPPLRQKPVATPPRLNFHVAKLSPIRLPTPAKVPQLVAKRAPARKIAPIPQTARALGRPASPAAAPRAKQLLSPAKKFVSPAKKLVTALPKPIARPPAKHVAPAPPKVAAAPRKSVAGASHGVQVSPRREKGKEVRGEKSLRWKEEKSPRRREEQQEEEEGSEMEQVRSTLEGLVSVITARSRERAAHDRELFEQSVARLNKKASRFLEELHEETEEIVVGARKRVDEAEKGAKKVGEMVRRLKAMRGKA